MRRRSYELVGSQKFTAALDALVEQIKEDRSILAVILCGSLSHDTVWAKSDIDLVLVTIDDQKVEAGRHRALRRRRERPRVADAAREVPGNGRRLDHATPSSTHSWRRDGCSIRTTRPSRGSARTLSEHWRSRHAIPAAQRGDRARCACIHKAHKWFVTRGRSGLHRAVDPLCGDAARADRDHRAWPAGRPRGGATSADDQSGVLPGHLHRDAQHEEDDHDAVHAALDAIDAYVGERADLLFAPIVEYLRDAGEARSATEIESHFTQTIQRHWRDDGVRVPGGSRTDRQSVDGRASDQSAATPTCRSWRSFIAGGSEDPPRR